MAYWLFFLLIPLNAWGSYRCDVYLDDQNIHHFKSEKTWDLFACLGYAHGKDRAFQMEYFRRVAQGRLAEIRGYKSIRSDFFLRLLDLPSLAARLYGEMDEKDKKWPESYADGVNLGLKEGVKKSYQLQELDIIPQPWKAEDSILLFLLQAFDQTKESFFNEIKESKILKNFSEAFRVPPWQTSILKPGEYPGGKDKKISASVKDLHFDPSHFIEGIFEFGMGSNNWAIAPGRSRSKNAWFANDPHLRISHPPFWYWVHLQGDDMDVMGASVPGLPTIPSGFNRHVAWGLTNAYVDVADVALVDEKELKDAQSFRPVIYFRFFGMKIPFFFKSFRRTKNGFPILPISSDKNKAYVVKWSAFFMKGSDLAPLYKILSVSNAKELDSLLAKIGLPTWNYVFADTKGQIAYRAVGKLPYRDSAKPRGLPEEKLADFEKPFRFFKMNEAPHVFNPARGYIATANNRHWGEDSLYNAGNAYSSSLRAGRIEELIKKTPKHNLESMQKIQCDVFNNEAFRIVPLLLEAMKSSKIEKEQGEIIGLFKKWDYQNNAKCLVCGVYRLWANLLLHKLQINGLLKEVVLYNLLDQKKEKQ